MSARHGLLLPVAAIVLGLTGCGSTPAPAPISAAPPSVVPTSARPAVTESPARKAGGGAGAGAGKCPSAKALEKLADLPRGWHIVASSVECWKEWATADPEGPTVGDGVYLFRYKAGSGWRYHSQGSGYHCKDLGINEAAPFCQYP
ncbi:hypothetical protein ACFP2T_26425 [Plantactinospora solaniradicis]|uniref:Lipoprotein n=1 Tax=Plantactinospora solaniradicis TaxID=1723736 RepID=A0ABW1KE42_9ACTN